MPVFLLVLVFILVAAAPASAAPGDLDPAFARGAGSERFLQSEEEIAMRGVAVQPDDKIVLAGEDRAVDGVLVVRLLANGEFDPSFGSGGTVTTLFPGAGNFGEARAVAVQPDGKIVIVGSTKGAVLSDFLVARYLPNGELDPGFGGGDGIEVVNAGAEEERAEAVAVDAAGRILLTGEAKLGGGKKAAGVAVLQPDGKPDPSFSADGATLVETTGADKLDEGTGIVEQPDGKIVVADSTGAGGGSGFTLVRLLANGLPDPDFDGDGVVRTPILPGTSNGSGGRVNDVALLPDGRIVAAGYGYDENGEVTDSKFAAVRYLASGQLDPSFGGSGTGIFSRQVGVGADDSASAIALTPAGRAVLSGGYEAQPGSRSIAALRLDPDGAPDPAFGSGGVVRRAVASPIDDLFADAALDSRERLVVVSHAFIGEGQTSVVVTRFLGDMQPPAAVAAVNRPPHARMKRVPKKISAAKLKGFFGTAADPDGDALRKVQVAVMERGRSCAVLNRKGLLRQVELKKGRPCPRRWLDAKGKAKWSFKLKHALPPGRYVVFSRAVAVDGLAETGFSRRAGNRFAFRVIAG